MLKNLTLVNNVDILYLGGPMTRREWKAEQLITLLLTEGLGELDAEGRELLLQKINELPLEKEAGKEEANVL